jgi:hypothetical protein
MSDATSDLNSEISKINQGQPVPSQDAIPVYCVTCKFFFIVNPNLFQCRRRAPTRNLDCSAYCFPPVDLLLSCGEFEAATRYEIVARKAILRPIDK